MEEARKYFDYELAYEMYEKCIKLLENNGIKALELEFEEVGDRANGYTSFYGRDYNTWVYVSNRNFDTNEIEDWYVSGEVDILSYNGGEDTLFITLTQDIQDRMTNLCNYAKENDYADTDIMKEYLSLVKVWNNIYKKID